MADMEPMIDAGLSVDEAMEIRTRLVQCRMNEGVLADLFAGVKPVHFGSLTMNAKQAQALNGCFEIFDKLDITSDSLASAREKLGNAT